jgi:hypothetical protein
MTALLHTPSYQSAALMNESPLLLVAAGNGMAEFVIRAAGLKDVQQRCRVRYNPAADRATAVRSRDR